jgi:2TM domain
MQDEQKRPYPSFPPAADDAWAYWRARRSVRALRGWYLHLLVYLAVNTWLWLRYYYSPLPAWSHHAASWPWPLSTTLGWGLGLCIHGIVVWWRLSRWGQDWETRKMHEFMARHRQ